MAENPIRDSKLGPRGGPLVPRVQKAADRREAKAVARINRGLAPAQEALLHRYLSEGYPVSLANLIVRLAYPRKRRVAGTARNPVYSSGISERDARMSEMPSDHFFPKAEVGGKRMPPPASGRRP